MCLTITCESNNHSVMNTSTWRVRIPTLWYLQCQWHRLHQKRSSFTTSRCHFSALIFIENLHDSALICRDTVKSSLRVSPQDGARFLRLNLPVTLWTFHIPPPAGHRKWVFPECEWAGVHGVQSAGPGPPAEGRVQRHGLLPGGAVSVRNCCPAHLMVFTFMW